MLGKKVEEGYLSSSVGRKKGETTEVTATNACQVLRHDPAVPALTFRQQVPQCVIWWMGWALLPHSGISISLPRPGWQIENFGG